MRLRVIPVVLSAIFTALCATAGFAQGSAAAAVSPAPAPRDASGKILFGGAEADEKGIWLPVFAIGAHLRPLETIPFKPWARGLYDARLLHQLEPHARCKASGFVRQFQTPIPLRSMANLSCAGRATRNCSNMCVSRPTMPTN